MPIYNFKNTKTDEIVELEMSMSEREEFLTNPEWEQVLITPLNIGDAVRLGVAKPPAWMTNKIRHMENTIHRNSLRLRKGNHNVSEI